MIIFPREKPTIQNLNSYYLDIGKLIEHYQGEFGSGGIHFRSLSAEGVVYFDGDELLSAAFKRNNKEIEGDPAIRLLMNVDDNFKVNIYNIDHEKVYYWSNLHDAKNIYTDLSTEYIDLEKLISKMGLEKLTGYVDVSIGKSKGSGLIFFQNGGMVGGSYSWGNGKVRDFREDTELLIQKTKEWGGIFNVASISTLPGDTGNSSKPRKKISMPDTLTMLEELLTIFEETVASNKKIKKDFSTLLKGTFLELADTYDFLDPFTGEFKYIDKYISFTGEASPKEVTIGILKSVKNLAAHLGLTRELVINLTSWSKRYGEKLIQFGISF